MPELSLGQRWGMMLARSVTMNQLKRWLPLLGALLLTASVVGGASLYRGARHAVTTEERGEGGEPAREETPAEGEEAISEGSQYSLLQQMLAAEESDTSGAYARTRAAWSGRRVRWEMMRLTSLCGGAARCYVSPFDYSRLDPELSLGFLPELSMDEEQHRAMSRACASYEPCVITFEATLERFVFSLERPTRMHLGALRFVSAREVREGEQWLRRHGLPEGLARRAAARER